MKMTHEKKRLSTYHAILLLLCTLLIFPAGCMAQQDVASIPGDYKDASKLAKDSAEKKLDDDMRSIYQQAVEYMYAGNFVKAITLFEELGDYDDAKDLKNLCKMQQTAEIYDKGITAIKYCEYESALEYLDEIPEYNKSSVLRNYCKQMLAVQAAKEACYDNDYHLFLELIEELPDCDETVELYTDFAYYTAFDPDAAYRLYDQNELGFKTQYPTGSIWTIDSYSNGVNSDFWTGDYYLSLDGHEGILSDDNIRCFNLPMNELQNINPGEHFVIVGEFDRYGGNFEFTNCRILSRTQNKSYAGKFVYSNSLYEISGAKKVIDAYTGMPVLISAPSESASTSGYTEPDSISDGDTVLIEMPYYSITLSKDWFESVYISTEDQSIVFTEKTNHDADYGGFLAKIDLYSQDEADEILSDTRFPFIYSELGYIRTASGDVYSILETTMYPDRTHNIEDEAFRNAYDNAANELNAVYSSITGINGCTYLTEINNAASSDAVSGKENDTKQIEMSYYSITVPSEWLSRVYMEIDESLQKISFYEKTNYDSYYGGLLAHIMLLSREEAAEYYYDHISLGTLTITSGRVYYVIAGLSSDVPYDMDTPSLRNAYLSAQDGLDAVYASITGINGCIYMPEN